MGGPSSSDYESGPDEQAAGDTAQFEYNRDKSIYGPITREYTEEAATTQDPQAVASRVANADTWQTLSGRPSLAAAQSVDTAANMASGAVAQQLQATKQGLGLQRDMQLGALEIGKNKKAITKLAYSDIAAQERSAGLATAKKKLVENNAAVSGALQLGTSFAYAFKNKTGIFAEKSEAPPDIDYTKGGPVNS